MCFMAPKCILSEHITCHRYRAVYVLSVGINKNKQPADGTEIFLKTVKRISASRTHSDKGYYRMYSSGFNGNITDSYL